MGRKQGFTLIEILFTIFISLLLMGAAYMAMISGQQSSTAVERKVAAQQDIRAALQSMGLEISMASYNPNYVLGIWSDLPAAGSGTKVSCQGSGDQTWKGIREATPTSLTVEMDSGESGQVGDAGAEIVRYNYDQVKQYITREVPTCGKARAGTDAGSFLGEDQATGLPRTVRVINNNLTVPSRNIVNGHKAVAVFRYYDGKADGLNPYGTEIYPGEDSTVIPKIRRIDITLAVETDEVDPTTRTKRQMTYSTSVLVRNHALCQ
jgi:prepilin-type N-terminal cleavage/methylation domain-containing protein